MFETLTPQPADALLSLIGLFLNDRRSGKLDLGVGTYRDESGTTPILQVVKAAERHLLETQTTKTYLGPEGDMRFVGLLREIVAGPSDGLEGRLVGVQTPGGGGALRLGADLIAMARPGATLWLGTPTWPNHPPIFAAARLAVREYRCFDPHTQSVAFDETCAALSGAAAGDVVLLHGCCHNPTGADLSESQWDELVAILVGRDLIPFVDLAYQGLGRGLEPDAYGVRRVLGSVREALVAYSCDKNFGLYRERTGALFMLADTPSAADILWGNLLALARVNWSMPPDHGAAVVRAVLESTELSQAWRGELEGMRQRIAAVRGALALCEPRLAFLARQHGMFSLLPLTRDEVGTARERHGIYMAGNGRCNLAGLRVADAERFVEALRAVSGFLAPP
jgi:aromatic-amino-acid transaminase